MMYYQSHLVLNNRIRLLRNNGTSDGLYLGVPYTEEERTYASSNRNAVVQYEKYMKEKRNNFAGKTDVGYWKKREDNIKGVWVAALSRATATDKTKSISDPVTDAGILAVLDDVGDDVENDDEQIVTVTINTNADKVNSTPDGNVLKNCTASSVFYSSQLLCLSHLLLFLSII